MASKSTASTAASAASTTARRASRDIGLNAVSAADYSGWDGPLAACEFDAHDMAAMPVRRMKSTVPARREQRPFRSRTAARDRARASA